MRQKGNRIHFSSQKIKLLKEKRFCNHPV